MRFGRLRPKADHPALRLRFGQYTTPDLPEPPISVDYSPAASECLSQMYLNDRLGCCVCSGGAHLVGAYTGNAGALYLCTDDDVLKQYEAIGGYNPSDPATDQGCDEGTAIAYWTNTGFPNGTKLSGAVSLNAANLAEIKQACWLFEGLFFGIELPDAWLQAENPGFVWDVAGEPNPSSGHCIVGVGYDDIGIKVCSWGMLGTLTWGAVQKYCTSAAGGAVYGLLSPDVLNKASQKAPTGFDIDCLALDLSAMSG